MNFERTTPEGTSSELDSERPIMHNMIYVTASAGLRCALCGDVKSELAFGINRRSPTGRHNRCKVCRNAAERAKYAENPEPQKAATRRYLERNRDQVANRRASNPDRYRESNRKAYAKRVSDPEGRESFNDYHRRYRAKHRERMREIQSDHHDRVKATNPELLAQKRRRRQERERRAGHVSRKLRAAVFAHYGPSCYLCDGIATEVDHYQPIVADGVTELANLRPACQGCNARKGDVWPFDELQLRARILAEYADTRKAG